MAAHGFWFWLLINLGYNEQFHQRLSKRSLEGVSEKCQEPRVRNSFLWVMERTPPVYFFGTIHVPYTKVWDYIPLNSKQAFYETDNIYFELDLTDRQTARTLAECQTLPTGIKLRDVVPLAIYKRIKRHLSYVRKMLPVWMTADQMKPMGLSPSQLFKALTWKWYKKRPIWIMLMLNGLTEYDIKTRGISVLDMYLIHEAFTRNKHIGSIESVEEQCKPLNALNNDQVMIALNQTLILHEKLREGKATLTYSTKELIDHYNCGDLTKVLFAQDMTSVANLKNSTFSDTLAIKETRKLDKYLRGELIYKRNKKMAKRVVQHIQEEPNKSFFFAFGAGHFLGNGSIIDILQKQGYAISHVHPDAILPSTRRKVRRKNKNTKRRRRKGKKHKEKHRKKNKKIRHSYFTNKTMTTRQPSHVSPTKKRQHFAVSSTSSQAINGSSLLWLNILIIKSITDVFEQ